MYFFIIIILSSDLPLFFLIKYAILKVKVRNYIENNDHNFMYTIISTCYNVPDDVYCLRYILYYSSTVICYLATFNLQFMN